jgi:hypothetical protein
MILSPNEFQANNFKDLLFENCQLSDFKSCPVVAVNGHHELNGSHSHPAYLTIGNLGDFSIMGNY